MKSVRSILVIQLRQLGDILMITPLLRRLKQMHPEAEIDVLCESIGQQLLESNPHLRRVVVCPRSSGLRELSAMLKVLRARHYDWVIDAQALPKTAVLSLLTGAPKRSGFPRDMLRKLCYNHMVSQQGAEYSASEKLRLSGEQRVLAKDLQLDFPLTGVDEAWAHNFAREFFTRPVAALFGVSRRDYKKWPPAKLAELGDRLAERGFLPWLVYGPGEQRDAHAIAEMMTRDVLVDYPLPSFPQLCALLGHCALFAGNDGGPKHLAALQGVPTVCVFGHVHPECWTRPEDPGQRWVATHSDTREHPTHGPCLEVRELREIPVDAVWKQVEALLEEGLVKDPLRDTPGSEG